MRKITVVAILLALYIGYHFVDNFDPGTLKILLIMNNVGGFTLSVVRLIRPIQ